MTISTINLLAGAWITFYNLIINNLIFTNNNSKVFKLGLFILFTLGHALNLEFVNPLTQIIFHILLIYLFTTLNNPKEKEFIIPAIIIIYLIRFIFEGILTLVLHILNIPFPSVPILIFITATLAIIFTYTFKEYLLNIIKLNFYKHYNLEHIISLNIFMLAIIFLRLINYWNNIMEINYISLITFLVIINLGFILMDEKAKINALMMHYQKLVEYSETTEELLWKYKTSLHENKNQLVIIQGLAKDNIELFNYVSFILEEKNKCEYHWLSAIKNIPISGLKGLINYKLLKMKEHDLNFEVYVQEEIENYQDLNLSILEKNDLYTILGIFLDNAIEAALESTEKMVSLQIYEEDNKLTFLIANTFFKVDLERIKEKGYSSKDKNRGIGLYLVNNIINKNKNLENITNVEHNFFTQKLLINLK